MLIIALILIKAVTNRTAQYFLGTKYGTEDHFLESQLPREQVWKEKADIVERYHEGHLYSLPLLQSTDMGFSLHNKSSGFIALHPLKL